MIFYSFVVAFMLFNLFDVVSKIVVMWMTWSSTPFLVSLGTVDVFMFCSVSKCLSSFCFQIYS